MIKVIGYIKMLRPHILEDNVTVCSAPIFDIQWAMLDTSMTGEVSLCVPLGANEDESRIAAEQALIQFLIDNYGLSVSVGEAQIL
jgi:hypothetical protein